MKHRNWTVIVAIILGIALAFATGAYIAQKFATPCVCILAQARIN